MPSETDIEGEDPRGEYEAPIWADLIGQRPSFYEGLDLYHFLMNVESWIHRRVEQVDFLDDRSVRRRVSVDLELPANAPERDLGGKPVDLLPLAFLRKEPLVGFDLRDEAGNVVPLLTRQQNAFFSWSILAAVGEAAARDAGFSLPLPLDVLSDLRLLTLEAPNKARSALKVFRKPNKRESRFLRRALMRDEVFASLAEALTESFLLLVLVDHHASARRVLKYSYVEPLPRVSFRAHVSHDVRSLLWFMRIRLGLEPVPLAFEVPALNEAAAYHFEVEAPRGLTIESAELVEDETDNVLVQVAAPQESRVHLYASPDTQSKAATSWVWLQPNLSGLVRTSAFFGVAVAVLLFLMAFRHDMVRSGAALTLLLTIPGFVAAFIVRPGEHLLASRLLLGFRSVVAALGFLPFLNGVTLVLGVPEEVREPLWWASAIVGALLARTISRSYGKAKAVAFPKG